MKENNLALISADELSLVEDNSLNSNQLAQILKRTPKAYVKSRPAKGGGTWDYVTSGYVKKVLNLMFGWDWDFEILDQQIQQLHTPEKHVLLRCLWTDELERHQTHAPPCNRNIRAVLTKQTAVPVSLMTFSQRPGVFSRRIATDRSRSEGSTLGMSLCLQ